MKNFSFFFLMIFVSGITLSCGLLAEDNSTKYNSLKDLKPGMIVALGVFGPDPKRGDEVGDVQISKFYLNFNNPESKYCNIIKEFDPSKKKFHFKIDKIKIGKEGEEGFISFKVGATDFKQYLSSEKLHGNGKWTGKICASEKDEGFQVYGSIDNFKMKCKNIGGYVSGRTQLARKTSTGLVAKLESIETGYWYMYGNTDGIGGPHGKSSAIKMFIRVLSE